MTTNISYLSTLNPHKRDSNIEFDEGPHIYTVNNDNTYMSVTTWIHTHFPKFDADKIIRKMMNSRNWQKSKYFGQTKNEIKNLWKKNGTEASAAGTKLHNDIELFYNKNSVINNSIEFKYFKEFYEDFTNNNKHLVPYRTEWMVYDETVKLAGSIDMIFENKLDNTLVIYDWKRSKEIKTENKWDNALTMEISHMPDTNFSHYSLQLNTYKRILEHNYNKKVVGMFLVCLHPNNSNKSYIKINVPNLTTEMDALFTLRVKDITIQEYNNDKINKKIRTLKTYRKKITVRLNKYKQQIEALNQEIADLENMENNESMTSL